MVTLNVAEWFGLADRGALAPGRRADVAVLRDLEGFEVMRTYHGGELVAVDGESLVAAREPGAPAPSVNVDWERVDLRTPAEDGARARVVELVPGAIVTGAGEAEAPVADGALAADPERDLARLCVIERHTGGSGSAGALVRGFGLREGALGSSVAHDHHNLIVAGTSDAEVEHAARALAELGGGLVAVRGGEVLASVPLPVAGLMSLLTAAEVSAQHRAALAAAAELGCTLDDPFMSLSFLGLEVIPELKLTDRGLVDVGRFEIVEPVVGFDRPPPG